MALLQCTSLSPLSHLKVLCCWNVPSVDQAHLSACPLRSRTEGSLEVADVDDGSAVPRPHNRRADLESVSLPEEDQSFRVRLEEFKGWCKQALTGNSLETHRGSARRTAC